MNVEHSFLAERPTKNSGPPLGAWLKKRRWFVAFVILPTIIASIYYGFIASDVYSSESRFVIKSPDQKRPQLSTLANLIQTTGLSSGQEQANQVLEFVRSRNALRALERDTGVRARFGSREADSIARFPQPFITDSFENLYKYYGRMVSAQLDPDTGTAILTVKAFTPNDAFEINRKLLQLSEDMVNRLNVRAQGQVAAEAEKQLQEADARARKARVALAAYRNNQEVIDPTKQAAGILDISNGIVAQRAALLAQFELLQRVTPRNPSIPALRTQINALSTQIASQDNRVVGPGNGIASKVGGYENLVVEQEFATNNLNAASAALVTSRNDAQRQQFYLERIVDPNLPDSPAFPHRLLSILVVAAAATFLYFIGWMLIVGILEHAPED